MVPPSARNLSQNRPNCPHWGRGWERTLWRLWGQASGRGASGLSAVPRVRCERFRPIAARSARFRPTISWISQDSVGQKRSQLGPIGRKRSQLPWHLRAESLAALGCRPVPGEDKMSPGTSVPREDKVARWTPAPRDAKCRPAATETAFPGAAGCRERGGSTP